MSEKKENYSLLGGGWEVEDQQTEEMIHAEELESYHFFREKNIRSSIRISSLVVTEAKKRIKKGELTVKNIRTGFNQYGGEPLGQIVGIGTERGRSFPVKIVFNRTAVVDMECNCDNCRYEYRVWDTTRTDCSFKAALLLKLEEYLASHNLGDSTNQDARRVLDFYSHKRSARLREQRETKTGSLQLVPKLIRQNGSLSVSFKIGEKKLYIVKNLETLCRNVKNAETTTYGKNTEINHSIGNFTEEGKNWFQFVRKNVEDMKEARRRYLQSQSSYFARYDSGSMGGTLELYGRALEEFYRMMGDQKVEFDDKDSWVKGKRTLNAGEGKPAVKISISEDKRRGEGTFHGIRVNGTLPQMYRGEEELYYIDDEKEQLVHIPEKYTEQLEPLAELSGESDDGNSFAFQVGRNHLSEFYQKVLPQLEDLAQITETDPKKFRSYLTPEARYTFYLDAPDNDLTCRPYAKYGNREVYLPDVYEKEENGTLEPFRDFDGEHEILSLLSRWFPCQDPETGDLSSDGDEDRMYQVMARGTEQLMELGEVRCTKRFRDFHGVRPVKVSVGVSVSSGLLELDIATDDVSPQELLDLLGSYRLKKKYYRLKDGSFVDLEESNLETLAQMVETLHLKPKEFIKGKMHLPMYRTLYLDKMLEENETIYSSRDSHFREVVKGFKTVKDADFEEPKSLSRIMRNYQKNGYKWLRTLEAWKFGGILADDMGLGKTLQMIAVLLAAKEEGKKGTSLVVAPASLVYNWGEELKRFAPALKVTLITGNQEERRAKIMEDQEADVMVTSYDLLKRDIAFYEDRQFLYEVIDEAQYIKNHTTAAAKAVKVINSQIRYALTGTPIENRLSELWSIFDYLMPGLLYGYDVFKKEIETPIVKNQDKDAMERLQKMAGPFILRRLKEDVLKDLPKKMEESRYVRLGDAQQKLYDGQVLHMKAELAKQDDSDFNKNKMMILAELTRLRQICCDPSLCYENYKGDGAKLEACMQLISSAMDGGHRMLVFSQFTSMLEILERELEKEKIPYFKITGSTSKEKRLQMVKAFNEGDTPVFLISLKAGGVGLNLTGADVVIHYDPWWNLAVQNQATDRAHRIGQTKKVTVYKLIAKGTIEEKIQELQEKKRDLAEQVIGGETGNLGSLSREEIMGLLEVS
jgi:hypothetical protein